LKAIELLFVSGKPNKEVASQLNLTEQQIANYKSDFQIRLRSIIKRMNSDEGVFPELADRLCHIIEPTALAAGPSVVSE